MRHLFYFLFLAGAYAHAQTPADSLIDEWGQPDKTFVREKLFVHTDQTFYLVGETMWFSIYAVDGSYHTPLNLSRIAYLEVLDGNQTPVIQTTVDMKGGRGQGTIYLPSSLSSGNYMLRAYTRLMRNDPPAYYFHQRITIVNQFLGPETPEPPSPAQQASVAFFPEGGNLVAGLTSRVGFRITAPDGDGISARGVILNQSNDTVAQFSSAISGIGAFDLMPMTDQRYQAILFENNGTSSSHPVPQASREGVVMRLIDEGENLVVSVQGKFEHAAAGHLLLFGHSRQISFFKARSSWDGRQTEFTIPKADMPGGIAHFTLFDEAGTPLCERLHFKHPEKQLAFEVNVDHRQLQTRRKVTATLRTDDPAGTTSFSVSVVRKDSLAIFESPAIYPYLWLSSDLDGEVKEPSLYFKKADAQSVQYMDQLMLIYGWRRFNWDDAPGSKSALKYIPEVRGHLVEATIENQEGPVKGELTYLSTPGNGLELYASRSNERGEILFEIHPRQGGGRMIIQSPNAVTSTRIQLKNPFSEAYATFAPKSWRLPTRLTSELLNRSIATQVEDIFSDDNGRQTSLTNGDTIGFYGSPDEMYYLDRYTRFPVMEEVMREYITGVFVRKRRDGFHFLLVDRIDGGVMEGPMILLDGVPLFHPNRIMEIDPLLVKKLDVVGRRYLLGPAVFNGIVSYMTYKGDFAGLEPLPGSLSIDYEVLQQQREFHHPQYGTRDQLASRIPDRRYLLYWNPQVTTNGDGEAEITFYTSDIKGTFEIQVHGLSADGRAGSTTKTFRVE